jgi:hypothetical protein
MKRYLRLKGFRGFAGLVAIAVTFSPIALTPTLLNQASAAITPGALVNLDASAASSYSGSGNTWSDLTSNGNNVTLSGATYDSGNKAINFSNSASALSSGNYNYAYFSTPSNFYTGTWTGFTATFFANMGTGANYWSRILDFSTDSAISGGKGDIYIARIGGSDDLGVSFWSADGSQYGPCTATGIISNSTFTHYAVTVDGSGNCYWYKNGTQFGSALSTGSTVRLPIAVTRTSLFLGRSHWNDTYLNGAIRNLAIYNAALTSQQVATNYGAQTGSSSDADLSALNISSGALSPIFASSTTSYSATVPNSKATITFTPTLSDANASPQIKLGSGSYSNMTSGSPSSISLAEGANTVTILVTAQNGSTTKTYTINILREVLQTLDFSNLPVTPVLLTFRARSVLKITMGSAGKVTFYANGRRIPGCVKVAATTLASCSYMPTTHGGIKLTAEVTPNSGSPYTVVIPTSAGVRSTKR